MSHHDHDDLHDRGLEFDLQTLFARRTALKLLAGAGLATLVGCSADPVAGTGTATGAGTGTGTATAGASSGPQITTPAGSASGGTSAAGSATSSAAGSAAGSAATACVDEVPEETAGPYPGDGSNGPNVLTSSGIVRSDIRSSFGTSTNTAQGVPLTIELTVQDSTCAPLAGAAVYLWHCTIDGKYSLYSDGVTDENYLRGVQEADSTGTVTFTSIFPAAYSGRWPHIHFEVYSGLSEATAAGKISATSQIALPEDICATVYATDGYSRSVQNLAQSSLETDMVFGDDGGVHQLATVTGSAADGYTASLVISV